MIKINAFLIEVKENHTEKELTKLLKEYDIVSTKIAKGFFSVITNLSEEAKEEISKVAWISLKPKKKLMRKN